MSYKLIIKVQIHSSGKTREWDEGSFNSLDEAKSRYRHIRFNSLERLIDMGSVAIDSQGNRYPVCGE